MANQCMYLYLYLYLQEGDLVPDAGQTSPRTSPAPYAPRPDRRRRRPPSHPCPCLPPPPQFCLYLPINTIPVFSSLSTPSLPLSYSDSSTNFHLFSISFLSSSSTRSLSSSSTFSSSSLRCVELCSGQTNAFSETWVGATG